jgi:putative SOS response-associated peptidase YedK
VAKHPGSCDKNCGHMLDMMTVPYTQDVQRLLDRDPRVVEYRAIDREWLEVVYACHRPVAAIYRASAAQLRIQELA